MPLGRGIPDGKSLSPQPLRWRSWSGNGWTGRAEAAKFAPVFRPAIHCQTGARLRGSPPGHAARGVACMSLEANKIAAAVLVGGMLTLSVGLISNMIYGGHEGNEGEKAAPAAAAPKPAPIDPVSPLLASADAAKGQDSAKICLTCHTFGKGEPAKVGPNLWGVVGGPTAHMQGFSYSEAVQNLKSTWTY